MIVIKESMFLKDNMTGESKKKIVSCSKCGTEHTFFQSSPVMCWRCNQVFPSARLLFESSACRLIYHQVAEPEGHL